MDKESIMVMVGKNIRLNRLSRNFSVDELAKLLEITPGFLGLVERGKRGISAPKLYKLSEIFDITMDVFFSDYDNVPKAEDPFEMLKVQIRYAVKEMNENELRFVMQLISCLQEYRNDINGSEKLQ